MDTEIACVLMRGGTSKGPFFLADDLPSDPHERDKVLLSIMGSPHELQINGLGGGNPLTSKVAIISRSLQKNCDVDYLFAQVSTEDQRVDTRPNCGNMLAAVAPFAIEQGLVPIQGDQTDVRIYNVNTKSRIRSTVQTQGGQVHYDGQTMIDGVPGAGSPIVLSFLDVAGSLTGQLFPTGKPINLIDNIAVTCIDCAIPIMAVAASALGKTGLESPAELDQDTLFLKRLESLRRKAGLLMGLGDVSTSVVPKPVLLSPSQGSAIRSRYFTPHRCHKAHAATGAIAVAACRVLPNTIGAAISDPLPHQREQIISVEHPAGKLDVALTLSTNAHVVHIETAGLIRTARRIMKGYVSVPAVTLNSI